MKTLFTFIVAILLFTVSNNASTPSSNENGVLSITGFGLKTDSTHFEVQKMVRFTNISVKKIVLFLPSPISPTSHLPSFKINHQAKTKSKNHPNYTENNTVNEAPSFLNLLFNFI